MRQLAAAYFLPSINPGMNYDSHTGVLAAIERQYPLGEPVGRLMSGRVRTRSRRGHGAASPACITSATSASGSTPTWPAKQIVQQREFETLAVRNQMLLQVATAYSELLRAEGRRAARIQARDEARDIAKITADYARTGQGRVADANRAATVLARWEASIQAAEAEILTASARLCQLVNLDPSIRLHPTDAVVVPQPIVPDPMPAERADRPGTAPTARAGGPARRDRGGLADPGRGQDPAVLAQLPCSASAPAAFGGGSNLVRPIFGGFGGREDLDVIVYWTLQNLGLGNVAMIRGADARLKINQFQQVELLNMVRADVAEAYARTHARYAQIGVYEDAVRSGYLAFHQDLDRTRLMVGAEGPSPRRAADRAPEQLRAPGRCPARLPRRDRRLQRVAVRDVCRPGAAARRFAGPPGPDRGRGADEPAPGCGTAGHDLAAADPRDARGLAAADGRLPPPRPRRLAATTRTVAAPSPDPSAGQLLQSSRRGGPMIVLGTAPHQKGAIPCVLRIAMRTQPAAGVACDCLRLMVPVLLARVTRLRRPAGPAGDRGRGRAWLRSTAADHDAGRGEPGIGRRGPAGPVPRPSGRSASAGPPRRRGRPSPSRRRESPRRGGREPRVPARRRPKPGGQRRADPVDPELNVVVPAPEVIPPPSGEYPIDLATALRLADVANPTINRARTVILEALAQQLTARTLLVPSLNGGASYHGQNGVLQRSSGKILAGLRAVALSRRRCLHRGGGDLAGSRA